MASSSLQSPTTHKPTIKLIKRWPLMVGDSDPMDHGLAVLGSQIAANRKYLCYGLESGAIGVLDINTSLTSLLEGLTQRVTHMSFVDEDVNLLASASIDGRVYVWKIIEDLNEGNNQITGNIIIAIQFTGGGKSVPRVCWHCNKQEVLVVGIGRHIWKIDTTKVGEGEMFSAEKPLICSTEKLMIDGIQLVGRHEEEVTDLSTCEQMTTRLLSASKDGSIKIWEDWKSEPIADFFPYEGKPVNFAKLLAAPDRSDHIILITGGLSNLQVKIWVLAIGKDSDHLWRCTQTLEFKRPKAPDEESFLKQVIVLSQAGLVLLPNAERNAIHALHLEYGSNPEATRMDYIAEFTSKMPILSFTGTSELTPRGEQQVKVYCIEMEAIQQYALELSQVVPPPNVASAEGLDVESSSSKQAVNETGLDSERSCLTPASATPAPQELKTNSDPTKSEPQQTSLVKRMVDEFEHLLVVNEKHRGQRKTENVDDTATEDNKTQAIQHCASDFSRCLQPPIKNVVQEKSESSASLHASSASASASAERLNVEPSSNKQAGISVSSSAPPVNGTDLDSERSSVTPASIESVIQQLSSMKLMLNEVVSTQKEMQKQMETMADVLCGLMQEENSKQDEVIRDLQRTFKRELAAHAMVGQPVGQTFSPFFRKIEKPRVARQKPARFLTSDGSELRVGAGFRNVDLSCYLNAVIQCLIHTVPFRDAILSRSYSDASEERSLLHDLRELIKHSFELKVVSPEPIVNWLKDISPDLKRYEEQDAAEFLTCFLETLESQNTGFTNMFRFLTQRELCGCHRTNASRGKCCLIPPIYGEHKRLEEILQSYWNAEAENAKCHICEKDEQLFFLPDVCIFCFPEAREKVVFPFDFSPYPAFTSGDDGIYSLYAIVVHKEKKRHYYCCICVSPDWWFKFNDHEVKPINRHKVRSKKPCMLFYRKKSSSDSGQEIPSLEAKKKEAVTTSGKEAQLICVASDNDCFLDYLDNDNYLDYLDHIDSLNGASEVDWLFFIGIIMLFGVVAFSRFLM